MEKELNSDWMNINWFSPERLNNEFEYANDFMPLPAFTFLLIIFGLLFLLITLSKELFRKKIKGAFLPGDVQFSWFSQLRHLPTALLAAFISLLILTIARPQISNEKTDSWSNGIDIMLTLDISGSMRALDFARSNPIRFSEHRLNEVKKQANKFIEGRLIDGKLNDRIGLVVFAGEEYRKCPLTTDQSLLHEMIEEIDFSDIPKEGTAMGDAIAKSVAAIRESHEYKNKAEKSFADTLKNEGTKIIILLTDGDNTTGKLKPETAAEIAALSNIKIYAIGIGKHGQVPYPAEYRDLFGKRKKTIRYIESEFNEEALKDIANLTGGKYFRAGSEDGLKKIFDEIDQMEKTEVKENKYKTVKDYYHIYLTWSVVFLLSWLFTKATFITSAIED